MRIRRGTLIRLKRSSFTLVILFVAFIVFTFVLQILEDKNFIETYREIDHLIHVDEGTVSNRKTVYGDYLVISRLGGVELESFSYEKKPGVYRIVIVGGSFAMGFPFQTNTKTGLGYGDISTWLEAILSMRFPSRKFEVVNAAISGQDSAGVLQMVGQLGKAEMDLLLVMTGNNEGYVPYARWNNLLHKWVLYKYLKRKLLGRAIAYQSHGFAAQTGGIKKINNYFKDSIYEIIESGRPFGVEVGFATLPINYRLQYQFPEPSPDLFYPFEDDRFTQGLQQYEQGEYHQALELFKRCKKRDEAALFVGRCYEKLGQYELAKKEYLRHAQSTPLGRTRPLFNETIRLICEKEKVPLFDLEKLFNEQTGTGLPEAKYFLDNCHLHWEGYLLAAREIIEILLQMNKIQGAENEPLASPDTESIIEEMGWEDLLSFDAIKFHNREFDSRLE